MSSEKAMHLNNKKHPNAVFPRVVAAVIGGYLLANLVAILLSYLLGSHADAVITGMLVSYLIYAGIVLWVFAASTARRAWIGIAIPSLICSVLILFLVPEGLL